MGAKVDTTQVISTFAPIANVFFLGTPTFWTGAKVDITWVISTFAPISEVPVLRDIRFYAGRKGGYYFSNIRLCDRGKSGYSIRRSRNGSRTNDQGGLLTSSGGLLERRGWTLETD